MIAGKIGFKGAIREAKHVAFVNGTKPTWRNYQRLMWRAKCFCSGREEFEAFSEKYASIQLDKARELLGTKRNGAEADWFADLWVMFGQDNRSAQAALERGIRAYRNCNEACKGELRKMVVGTINRLIGRLLSKDVQIGKVLGILRIKSMPLREAEGWATRLAEFGCDATRALYGVYERCLNYNNNLSQKLRMKLREIAIRIAPNNEEKRRQLKKFQEECGKME